MLTLPLGIRARRLLAGALVAAALLVVAWRHAASSSPPVHLKVAPVVPAPPRSSSSLSGASRARPAADAQLVVDVAGAVRRPGLVHVPQGARVADVVELAGGLARHADRSAVNLAAPVSDGQQVLVPVRGIAATTPGAPAAAGAPGAPAAPVPLSTATAEQLDALPGVGPVTAQKILAYRTEHGSFHSVDELDAIPGIGPARLADLRGLVVP